MKLNLHNGGCCFYAKSLENAAITGQIPSRFTHANQM